MKRVIQKITSIFKKLYPGEIITAIIILSLINYFYYPEDPGIFNSGYNPYFILVIFISCFYGKISGILTLFLSVISIVIIFIIINYNSDISPNIQNLDYYFLNKKYNASMQFIFMSFIFSIIFGEIRDTLGVIIKKHKEKVEELIVKEDKLDHEVKAIALVNEEYQDRILGQQNSLISLYSTMIALNSLDMGKIYPSILEAVGKFSGAEKSSLWQYSREENVLRLLAYRGWDESKPIELKMSDSDNITGWVARNNEMFSVKLLQKHANLLEIDKKQNIITVPIKIDNRVWGIINVEEMPFVKYNLYSEQLIMMIADLAAPIISNAIRFEEISRKGEVDEITGLPSLDEMFSVIKKEFAAALAENTKLSFVVVELINSEELIEKYSNNDVLQLLRSIVQTVKRELKKDAMIFQYKSKFQFSLILPNVDYDGAAMFCLSFIEKINKDEFIISENIVHPEVILGYSSMRPNLKSEEDILMLAENLLEMQKI
jgi:polysaccharide biosynthesis protein PelD